MAAESIKIWHEWNELFGEELYHETGFLLLCKDEMGPEKQAFEYASFRMLQAKSYQPQRLNQAEIAKRFPAFSKDTFVDGFFHSQAGYAESALVIEKLAKHAQIWA